EARRSECRPGVHRTAQQLRSRVEIAPVCEHARQMLADQAGALEGMLVSGWVVARHVEGFRAMCECVHCRAAALCARELERQLRLIDDPRQVRAAAAADHELLGISNAEERRPLRA